MSIYLRQVPDAKRIRFSAESRAVAPWSLPRSSGDEGGGKNGADPQILTRLASPSSTVRLRFPGADAVLSISIELDEADSMRDSQSVIDLSDSEFGNDPLAAIMRWLGGRLDTHPGAPQRLASGGLTKWRLRRVLTYIDQHICEFDHARNASRGCRAEQNVLRRAVPGRYGLQAARVHTSQKDRARSANAPRYR